MIRLVVHQDARALGIVNPIACLIRKMTVRTESNLAADVDDLMTRLRDPRPILETAEAVAAQSLLANLGYPKTVPAGQRLVESLAKRGFKSYNNVIDACNVVSALHAAGLGLHDAAEVLGDIHVRRAGRAEQIHPLFGKRVEKVRAADLVYTTGDKVLAWLGAKDVDADEFKITDRTEYVLLMVLGSAATSAEYNREIALGVIRLVRKSCPEVYAQFIPTIFEGSPEPQG